MLALTGAGMSAESGIAPFRGSGGIWSRFDPMEYATTEALARDPAKVWQMLHALGLEIAGAAPNAGHRALARLAERIRVDIATQNVDGLHQRAGSRDVIELHGGGTTLLCMACGGRRPSAEVAVDPERLPPRCACGGVLRPDVVLFGEMLPDGVFERAAAAARAADTVLVVGTSAEVAPASLLPGIARQGGALVIEVNPEETWITGGISHIHVPMAAGEALPSMVGT